MADSSIPVTAGVGTPVDTRTMPDGNHRQAIVIGDPVTNAGVAPVDEVNGLKVDAATVAAGLVTLEAKIDLLTTEVSLVKVYIGDPDDSLISTPTDPANLTQRLASADSRIKALVDQNDIWAADGDPTGVVSPFISKTITPTLSTTPAYSIDDILFDFVELTNVFRQVGFMSTLDSIVVLDEDNQKITCDLYFAKSAISFGTINTATAISKVNSRQIIASGGPSVNPTNPLRLLAADYQTHSSNAVAMLTRMAIGLPLSAAAAATSLWVGALTRGAPTHSAAGLTLTFNFTQF